MARFSYIINNFLGGEISQKSIGRTDLETYKSSCEALLNAHVNQGGGAFRRRGSVFVKKLNTIENEVGTSWGGASTSTYQKRRVRLIPFIFSKTEAYVVMFGVNSSNATTAQPIYIFNVADTSQIITIDLTTAWSAIAGVATPHQAGVFSGFSSKVELEEAQYTQINDVLIVSHQNHPPCVLVRTAVNTFELRSIVEQASTSATNSSSGSNTHISRALGYPFRDTVVVTGTSVTMSINNAAVGTGRTLTASTALYWGGFQSSHVGAHFKHTVGGQTGLCVVTGVTSTTVATVQVILSFGGTGASSDWQESSWSDYRGWPRTVMYHQNRLMFGGNSAEPNTVWASESGDIGQFTREADYSAGATWTGLSAAASSDPFQSTISSDEANLIQWMKSDKNIILGTQGREYICNIVTGSSTSSLSFSPETAYGSKYLQAKKFGSTLMFVDRSGVVSREFVFNFQEDNYRSENISELAEHLPGVKSALDEFSDVTTYSDRQLPEIVETQAQNSGNQSILWMKDTVGGLFSVARDRSRGFAAWSRHIMGETPEINELYKDGGVEVRSICTVPNAYGTHDDLWVAVSRTINSVTDTYIEKICGNDVFYDSPMFVSSRLVGPSSTGFAEFHPVYTDSSVIDVSGNSVITGLSHLEGETVWVTGNGEYLGSFTVSGGQVDVGDSYAVLTAGLKYMTLIQPVQIEAGSRIGSAQGIIKKAEEAVIRFHKTKSCKIAVVRPDRTLERTSPSNAKIGFEYDSSDFLALNFLPGDLSLGQIVPLFTGDKTVKLPNLYGINNRIALYTDLPLPMNVLAIIFKGITYDG